ncbi:YitT family protein [Staphylococcus pettenkoferi]|uniref:YitT family protein n=1 Tax=Staphylococcus pettenkoferi TaxID=170573 RepID=UPI00066D1C18|nr:YitT family protein [Staphylococcus pettenkoferi]MDK7114623.1 YitT family protein [Staphylococcus pettenkoferi]MDK7283460.1 YitT family protein [Staphylococcus pettenkoferi]
MSKKAIQIHTKNIIFCLLGTFLIGVGVNAFIIAANLGEGGTVGISLNLKYTLGLSPALTSFIINIILIAVGWKYLSKTTAIYTLITVIASSVWLALTESFNLHLQSDFINSIFGGAFIGIGTGFVISARSTLGGTSVVAKIIDKYTEVKTSQALFVLDTLIVLSFLITIDIENVLYTIVMLFIVEKCMAFVIEGFNPKKAITIISEYNGEISDQIHYETGRGSTLLNGVGGYERRQTNVLYVVVPQNQLARIKKIVNAHDSNAFLVIHDVRDVLGNGFMKMQ